MRRISFSLTERQLMDGTKTVTRRLGWEFLRPGDELVAVRKCMGLRKGERQHVLCQIRVKSVRRESLDWAVVPGEAAAEGFPEMTGSEFVLYFAKAMKCGPLRLVTRIEFERVTPAP